MWGGTVAYSPEQAEKGVILKILAGSHVHGLNVATSDRDIEAIVVEPIDQMVRIGQPWEDIEQVQQFIYCPDAHISDLHRPEECGACVRQPDVKYFSLRKWCRMAANGNPNFLLILFAPKENILAMNALGSQLREMKDLFLSKGAIRSHLGYMQGQRTRMVNHQREFGAGGGRGKPRFELIEKLGYDTKFAMHLLRLALQGLELATSSTITLPMAAGNRETLLSVRQGKMSLGEVLDWAAFLEAEMKKAFDASALPPQPDLAAIDAWMQKIYLRTWSAQRRIEDIREDQERLLLRVDG